MPSHNMNKFLSWDKTSGILRCEAGEFRNSEFAVPRGYFLSVSPGTKYVTVGAASQMISMVKITTRVGRLVALWLSVC